MSAATSFYSTAQQLSTTIGVALAAPVLQVFVVILHHGGPRIGDFTAAFLVIGLTSGLSVPLSRVLAPDAGAEVSGYRRGLTPQDTVPDAS